MRTTPNDVSSSVIRRERRNLRGGRREGFAEFEARMCDVRESSESSAQDVRRDPDACGARPPGQDAREAALRHLVGHLVRQVRVRAAGVVANPPPAADADLVDGHVSLDECPKPKL